jgi:hypothetical protein
VTRLAAAALFLLACDAPVRDGVVMDRRFVAAHSTEDCVTSCTDVAGVTVCVPLCTTTYHPDRWYLDLGKCDNGNCRTGTVQVERSMWEQAKVGDRFPPAERP